MGPLPRVRCENWGKKAEGWRVQGAMNRVWESSSHRGTLEYTWHSPSSPSFWFLMVLFFYICSEHTLWCPTLVTSHLETETLFKPASHSHPNFDLLMQCMSVSWCQLDGWRGRPVCPAQVTRRLISDHGLLPKPSCFLKQHTHETCDHCALDSWTDQCCPRMPARVLDHFWLGWKLGGRYKQFIFFIIF